MLRMILTLSDAWWIFTLSLEHQSFIQYSPRNKGAKLYFFLSFVSLVCIFNLGWRISCSVKFIFRVKLHQWSLRSLFFNYGILYSGERQTLNVQKMYPWQHHTSDKEKYSFIQYLHFWEEMVKKKKDTVAYCLVPSFCSDRLHHRWFESLIRRSEKSRRIF